MPDWSELFAVSASPLELVVRGSVTFVALLLMMRIVGQREAGGLGLTDVLLIVLVAQAVSGALGGGQGTITDGLIVVASILFWSVALDAASYRWPRLAALLKARPRLLIEDGRPNLAVMRREFMTREELVSQLRLHGLEDLGQVRRAWLEPSGLVSVIRYDGGEADGPAKTPARP